jgi:hypothetical protein
MEKTNKNPMTEIEQLAATITEGTKSTLRDILSEAVSNYLREEVLNEDDDDDVEETQDAKSSDVPEFEETSDDAESDDADDVIEEPEKADEENEESEGDEWADFEDYKIGDDEGSEQYDFTNETNPETLIKVFKLMKNDDQVSVVKDGDKVSIKDNEADTEYVIELNGDTDNFENNDLTMTESLGYTDNYQDKDPIEGLSMDNATPKNTKDWHKGVPTGTNKPWAGKGKNEPFGKKTEKVFEITLNDEVEVENEEEPIEENVTTSKYQQRRMVKTMAPENAYVQDGAHEVSQGGKLKVESLQKKIDAALLENKQLKETVAKVSKIMKEAVQVNVNLGHIVRLMVENSTTKAEKEDIVKRYSSVKTNDEAKSLYESISSELKKSHSTIMTEQTTTAESSKKINESKIYDEPNGVLDMMKRMNMI